jgi:hypothetical protein
MVQGQQFLPADRRPGHPAVSTLGGRCAIVTGGATGIGLGITRRLLADGAQVLIAALTEDELKQGQDELEGADFEPGASPVTCRYPGRPTRWCRLRWPRWARSTSWSTTRAAG